MSERQANAPTMRALLPSRLVPEDMLSEWQGPNLPNTKNYAPAEDSIGYMIGNALSNGVAFVGGFTGLPMSDEGNRAALLGELLAAGMPLVGGIKSLRVAKVLAGPAWEKALRFYAEAGGLAERHVPRMADALRRAGIKVPARSVAEKVAAHKIVNEALDLAHTPAGPVEGPFATPQGIKAFHGSPHDFDQFSLSKIGTGEGNQSYLRGLYFAEDPAVAAEVRKMLSRSPLENPTFKGGQNYGAYQTAKRMSGDKGAAEAARLLRDHLSDSGPRDRLRFEGGTVAQEAQTLKERLLSQRAQAGPHQYAQYYDDAMAGIDKVVKDIDPKDYRAGRTYEVSINADPEDFLDWDAPLSQQSEKVQQKLPTYLQPQEGENMGDALRRIRMDENPEEGLRAAGIPGIKYLDGGSRGGPKNPIKGGYYDQKPRTRNYVVFDDKLISIVKKYGIAGALSAGAINELEARQLQAQGYQ